VDVLLAAAQARGETLTGAMVARKLEVAEGHARKLLASAQAVEEVA